MASLLMKNKKDIIKAIRLTWLSLDSHLDSAIDKKLTGRVIGDKKFHKKTAMEYNFIIKTLLDLL